MKHLLLLVLWLSPLPAFALTAEWERNTEPDMKEYAVYMCETKGCTVSQTPIMQKAVVPHPLQGVKPTWPVPDNKEGAIAVSARDASGNESPLSNVVPFDSLKPLTPAGLAVK